MAVRMPQIPKVRVRAEVTLTDGTLLVGHVFIMATSRIQDLLNAEEPFFAFVDSDGELHLINKMSVVQVRPHD
jgi:hypothetical protein